MPARPVDPDAAGDSGTARLDADLRMRSLLSRGLEALPAGLDVRRSGAYHRVRLGSDLRAGSFDARVELQGAGAFGAAGPLEAPLQVGLQQAWLRWRTTRARTAISVEAGRMALQYGSGRQIGRYDFHPTGHAFDGVRVRGELDRVLVVDLLATRLRRDPNQQGVDRGLYGVLATAQPTGSLTGDVYLLVLRDGDESGRHQLQTMGLRLQWEPWGVALAELETAAQFGRRSDDAPDAEDRFAHMIAARLGAFGTLGLPFGGGLMVELYSGDDDPDDGVERAWRPLYPDQDRIVGLLQRFSPSNLRAFGGWLELGARERLSARVEGRLFAQLAAPRVGDRGSGWQAIAGEIDGRVRWTMAAGQQLELAAGVSLPSADPASGTPALPLGAVVMLQWRGRFASASNP